MEKSNINIKEEALIDDYQVEILSNIPSGTCFKGYSDARYEKDRILLKIHERIYDLNSLEAGYWNNPDTKFYIKEILDLDIIVKPKAGGDS